MINVYILLLCTIIILFGIFSTLREIKYQIEHLIDMFDKNIKTL